MSKRTGLLIVSAVVLIAVIAAVSAFFFTSGDNAKAPENRGDRPLPHASRTDEDPTSDRSHRTGEGLAGGGATNGSERTCGACVRDRPQSSALGSIAAPSPPEGYSAATRSTFFAAARSGRSLARANVRTTSRSTRPRISISWRGASPRSMPARSATASEITSSQP
jgi:hypothetical protein